MIPNEKVVARWALGDPAKWPSACSRNLYFEGPTLYSYGRHFPLARWTVGAKGGRCVLANLSEKRSVSTSRHQSLVARRRDMVIYDVPDVMADDHAEHLANKAAWLAQVDLDMGALKRMRSLWRKAYQIDSVDRMVDNVRRYANAFDLGRVTNPIPVQDFAVGEVVTAADQWSTSAGPQLAVVERRGDGRRWQVRSPVTGQDWSAHEVCLTRSK